MRVPVAVALSVGLIAACHHRSRVEEGMALLDHGEYGKAAAIAAEEARAHPEDKEAHLLQARVYMLGFRPDDAVHEVHFLESDPNMSPRIAAAYLEGAVAASRQKQPPTVAMTKFAVAAAQHDPARQPEACQTLLGFVRKSNSDVARITTAAASISESCKRKTLQVMRSLVDDAKPRNSSDVWLIEAIAKAASQIDPPSTNEFAIAMREVARKTQKNQTPALLLLQAAGRVDPSINNDPETFTLRSQIAGSYSASAPAPEPVSPAGSPLESTKRVMMQIGDVISQYRTEHNRAPLAKNFDELERALQPYIRMSLPRVDGWGNAFEYVSSPDTPSGRLISGGADGRIDEGSRRVNARGNGKVFEFGADLIWEDGKLIQEPDEAALHSNDTQRH